MSPQIQCLFKVTLFLLIICGVNADLLHRYSFTDGDMEAVDSVSGQDGTLENGALVSGNAVQLDGSDDYVNLPGELIADTNSLSIELWYTYSLSTTDWMRVFDLGDTSSSGNGSYYLFYTPRSNAGLSRIAISDADPGYNHEEVVTYSQPDILTPVYVAFVYDGDASTMTLYVDGQPVDSTSVSIPLSAVDNVHSYLGKSSYNNDPYLKGSIDEFRIYDHALSDEEILYNNTAGPDLLVYEHTASNPIPEKNATSVNTASNLSWSEPNSTPDSYTVSISENSDLSASLVINVTGTECSPALESQTTYYWRVDTNYGDTTYTGIVWNFTTCTSAFQDTPPGDWNLDYEVSFADLTLLAEAWLDSADLFTYAILSENWLVKKHSLIINEFMAENDEYLADPDGLLDEYDDWIEIYNRSSVVRDLSGMYLTDDLDNPTKWMIPEGVMLDPYGYLLFWADEQPQQGNRHTNFKLDSKGEEIGLFGSDGVTLMDSIDYDQQIQNMSYGRYPDNASVWNLFAVPTPERCNCEGYDGVVSEVNINVDGGIFSGPEEAFDVYISCDTPGTIIRYTTDFTEPTETSTQYTGSIHIDSTTCLRAKAFKTDWYSPSAATRTFIFLDDVMTQSSSPVGFPAGAADYEVDPNVVNNPAYAATFKDDLRTIPSICIVTPNDSLFGSTGIYTNWDGRGDAWERNTSVEVIEPDQSNYYQANAGIRISGGVGRQGAKKGFRIIFRGSYGPSKMKYPLFEDSDIDVFDQLVLRNTWNYSWFGDSTCCSGLGTSSAQYMRELYGHDTVRDMGGLQGYGRHVHLYINGLYWGLYILTERPDEGFAAEHLGGSKNDYDVVKTASEASGMTDVIELVSGDMETWNQLFALAAADLSVESNYTAIQDFVDIPALIDYMLMVFHTGSRDAPTLINTVNTPRNFYAIRKREPGAGFVFLPWDVEWSLENETWDRVNQAYETGDKNPAYLFNRLKTNEEFRLLVADHIYQYYFNGGALTEENTIARYWSRSMDIDRAIVGESARWGDVLRTIPYTRDIEWVTERNRLIDTYFPARDDIVLSQLRTAGLYPYVETPVFYINGSYQHGGYISSSDVISFTQTEPSGTIYYTTDGSDPRLQADDSQDDIELVMVAETAPKKVWVPSGPLSGTGSILAEYWMEIPETSVSDLTSSSNYPYNPSSSDFLNSFEIPTDWSDNYGTRIRGYLIPPADGDYTFWIASDDNSQLWLSTNDDPANVSLIASVNEWTNSREWTKFPSQESASISLTAGQRYYIEALHKEATGGDNLAVSWEGPGFNQEVIDGAYLSPSVEIWTMPGFDDTGWTSGTGGVGYENSPGDPVNYAALIDTDVKADMYTVNPTCYIRIPFTISDSDLNAINTLHLNIRYDDGFIAYLNGVKIAEVFADSNPAWNSAASDLRNDSVCLNVITIDISSYIGSLVSGDNMLSIHGMNRTVDSSDFLISTELIAARTNPGALAPTAIEYTVAFTLDESTHIKSRALDGTIWSALNEAVYAVEPVSDNLRITELMYHPADPNTEFIELQNVGNDPINPALTRFTNGVDFVFPSITIPANGYVLVVEDPNAFRNRYGTDLDSIIAGHYEGSLDNNGEGLTLVDPLGSIIQDFDYQDTWYDITDGEGFSLTIIDPDANDPNLWDTKDGWRPSAAIGGSPGNDDSGYIYAPGSIVINEVLAHTDDAPNDWIELHNTTDELIPIGGWFLSDSNDDDPNYMKYRIVDGTYIPAGGYLVITQDDHFGNPYDPGCITPFALSENGETVYLRSGAGNSTSGYYLTGYFDQEDFGASEIGVAFGRHIKSALDGGGINFVPMSTNTPGPLTAGTPYFTGEANAYPKVGPVIINEVHYNPVDGGSYDHDEYEYIELYNISGSTVYLQEYDNILGQYIPWAFTDGIDYTFTLGTSMAAGEKIYIAKNLAAFSERYPSVTQTVYGPYSGKLNNGGEKLELGKPGDELEGIRLYIREDRVSYDDQTPWPLSADGIGHSLQQKTPTTAGSNYGNDVINWQAAPPTPDS